MSTFSKADTKAQWFAGKYPGAKISPNCGVLHTTETTGWPPYAGGSEAPNYTAKPDMKAQRLTWRAHFPDEMSSRALVNAPGGVETNTANAVQVELVGTCDPAHAKTWGSLKAGVDYIYWPTAPDWALAGVAEFLRDMHTRHSVPLTGVRTWLPYPKSYGSAGGQRMTFAQWRAFTGWCGHQHVPENDHGDPGALDFARILTLATPQGDDMSFDADEQTQIRANVRSAPITLKDGTTDTLEARVGYLVSSLAALDKKVSGLAPAQPTVISDEQLERVLRKVMGSVDNTPSA